MFSFAMTTIVREPEYFFRTMTSFLAADRKVIDHLPLHIYLGNPLTVHTNYIVHHSLFKIYDITWDEWQIVYDGSTIQRFNFNMSRLLKLESMQNTCGLILFEDDIKFVDNWFTIFKDLLVAYPMLAQSFVQLYHMHDGEEPFLKIPYDKAIGSQCIFIPHKLLAPVSEIVYKEGVLTPTKERCVADIILIDYCEQQNIPIYGINPTLVQHEGLHSTGLGGGYCGDYKQFSSSPTFHKRLENVHQHGYWLDNSDNGHFFDQRLAEGLVKLCAGKSVGDFGCGRGFYVKYLNEYGITAEGYDGNPTLHANNCFSLDLAQSISLNKKYDWVLCLEVIEHIPQQFEDVILNNIDKHCKYGIILSWAAPEQTGRGHHNERSADYVVDKMVKLGYSVDEVLTAHLRRIATYRWFQNNLTAFIKADIV